VEALRRALAKRCGAHLQWLEDELAEQGLERSPGSIGDERAQRVKPAVGVDPARPRRGDRRQALEGQARGVGEQVADRRARRPGRFLEPDHPAIDLDENGERGRDLGDRGPSEDPLAVAARGEDARRLEHRGRSVLGAPGIDRGEGCRGVRSPWERTGAGVSDRD
jgi:hypothetical protein